MDEIARTLQHSTDAEARKQATSQLRRIQEAQPVEFLEYTWNITSNPSVTASDRFFVATMLMEFVENSWRGALDKAAQVSFSLRYAQLMVSQELTAAPLARKVAQIAALMTRRTTPPKSPATAQLPSPMHEVVSCYVAALAPEANGSARKEQALLALHLLLKEMRSMQIGKLFPKLCESVAPVYQGLLQQMLSSFESAVAHRNCSVLTLKGCLRVFGHGTFYPGVAAEMQRLAWVALRMGGSVTSSSSSQGATIVRIGEYAIKILEQMVTLFPSELHTLSPVFFIDSSSVDAATRNDSLFLLTTKIVTRSPDTATSSEKIVCRSMRLVLMLLSAEEGDNYLQGAFATFAASPLLEATLRALILQYLADDTNANVLAEWQRDPERYFSELDVDMDDDASPSGCAEQLLLAFTSSPGCAANSLRLAWEIVNQCLTEDSTALVTAALHATGICYNTMSSGQDPAGYVSFLTTKLLPLLRSTAAQTGNDSGAHQVSPFVVRRTVWLVGMWCEVSEACSVRQEVHAVLQQLWSCMDPAKEKVILLSTLRCVSCFITDMHFTVEELPSGYVDSLFMCLQRLLPTVYQPSTVKELSELVYILIEKGAIMNSGEVLIQLLAPAVQRSMDAISNGTVTTTGGDSEDEDGEDGMSTNFTALGAIIDCLASSLKITKDDTAIWSLWQLVSACVSPGHPAKAWIEDNAWELLLSMVRYTQQWSNPEFFNGSVLPLCLQQLERDFESLPTVVRVVYSIVVLGWPHYSQVGFSTEECSNWASTMVRTCSSSADLSESFFALTSVALRASSSSVSAAVLMNTLLPTICSVDDVQSEDYAVNLGVLIALALRKVFEDNGATAGEGQSALLALPSATVSTVFERLVLIIDVSSSVLASKWIISAVQVWAARLGSALSAQDNQMIAHAAAGVEAAEESSQLGETSDAMQEKRDSVESVAEVFGDETANVDSPHIRRVAHLFL